MLTPDISERLQTLPPLYQQLRTTSIGPLYELLATKDKGAGLFYTPAPLAISLVEQSLGAHLKQQLSEINEALRQNNRDAARALLHRVSQLKIADPSCGCGVFLEAAFQSLYRFYTQVQALDLDKETEQALELPTHPARHIFTYQIYGVDLDETAVALAEWRLATLVYEREGEGFTLHPNATNLAVGNALASETLTPENEMDFAQARAMAKEQQSLQQVPPSPLRTRAFSWGVTFPEASHWDFILGNPPYITEVRQQSELFRQLRTDSRVSHYYQAKMDLCDAFVALGFELLCPGGTLAFVLPEYWFQRAGTRPLRETLWPQIQITEYWRFGEASLFPRAPGHHTSLLVFKKVTPSESRSRVCAYGVGTGAAMVAGLHPCDLKPGALFLEPAAGKILVGERAEIELLQQLYELPQPLLAPEQIQQGVVLPQGRLKSDDWETLPEAIRQESIPDGGIFLLTPEEIKELRLNTIETAVLKPFYGTHEFNAYSGFTENSSIHTLLYLDLPAKVALESQPERYPNLTRHLNRYRTIITSSNGPYGLHRPRQSHWFEGSARIFSLRQTSFPCFAVVSHPAYVSEGFYIMRPEAENTSTEEWNHTVCGILNSTLAWYWFYMQKRKGERLQIDKEVLCSLPKPPLASDPSWCHEVSQLAQSLQKQTDTANAQAMQRKLDALVYTGYSLSAETFKIIEQQRWPESFNAQWSALAEHLKPVASAS